MTGLTRKSQGGSGDASGITEGGGAPCDPPATLTEPRAARDNAAALCLRLPRRFLRRGLFSALRFRRNWKLRQARQRYAEADEAYQVAIWRGDTRLQHRAHKELQHWLHQIMRLEIGKGTK